MRKGTILLFLGKNEDRLKCMEFLKENLNPIICDFNYGVDINGYHIHIFKNYEPSYCRGVRSEICYINSSIDIKDETNDNNKNWFDVRFKTEMYSNRKEPVRIINSFEDINLNELLDDNYALENTIDKNKMNNWNEFLNTLKNNKEGFEREYDCNWIKNSK